MYDALCKSRRCSICSAGLWETGRYVIVRAKQSSVPPAGALLAVSLFDFDAVVHLACVTQASVASQAACEQDESLRYLCSQCKGSVGIQRQCVPRPVSGSPTFSS